jgi:hypothetical protein
MTNFEKTERRVERDLQHHPHDFHHVYKELDHLRHHESAKQFNHDLHQLNHDLHKKGLLPHLEIMSDGRNLAVVHDSSNPKHAAVVSRDGHRPHESEQERHSYKHMHYDGWKQSDTGGVQHDGDYNGKAQEGKVPTGNRKDLVDQALKLAGVPVNAANEAAVNSIIQHESGWNPNAINRTDSNARAGHPSQGLMQTIPSTFHQYAVAGYNSNITDPLSNVAAGIRYSVHRYGSLQNVPGVRALAHGGHYVGY